MNESKPRRLLVVAPLLIAAICLPLALELIGPNPLYGVRTAATRLSEAEWYRINRISGAVGVAAGLIGFAVNTLIVRSRLALMTRNWACLGVLFGVALAVVATSLAA